MKTTKDVTVKFMDYGEITIPKGTALTNQTACGIDKNYHFVSDLSWIDKNYSDISRPLKHDSTYYGINIPKEFVDYENTLNPYQPKTGAKCSCKKGIQRDNCPSCEGTGWIIDFKQIRDRHK